MQELIFWSIIAILCFSYGFDSLVSALNFRHSQQPNNALVKELYGIYKYRKWALYQRANYRLGGFSELVSFVGIMVLFCFQGFQLVDAYASAISSHYILNGLLFVGFLALLSGLISLPFSYIATFKIEQRFGFNTSSVGLFFTDTLRSTLLAMLLGGGLFILITWLYYLDPERFWVYAWVSVSGFSLFMASFYSVLIVPLFNKQTPLAAGELRNEIERFCQKVNFKLDNIYTIDGSKRSTKANAYFTGFWKKKRVVLYDTLIQDCSTEELVAILAHEIGHYKKKHIQQSILQSTLQTGGLFYLLSLVVASPVLSQALGIQEPKFHVGIVVFSFMYAPVSELLGIFSNWLSRKNEREADSYAATHYPAKHLISSLKKLASKNLSNLNPHPLHVFLNYSHPPIEERVHLLEQLKTKHENRN